MAVAKVLGSDSGAAAAAPAAAEGGADAAGDGDAAAAAAPLATFSCDDVIELQRRGDAACALVKSWWPAPWESQMPQGEPDRTVLAEKIIPLAEEKAGAKFAAGKSLPTLQGVLYVTRRPDAVPPGALDQLGVAGQGIAEGEAEEEEQEQVVQV